MEPVSLQNHLPDDPTPDNVFTAFTEWAEENGITLYPHQEEALLNIVTGNNSIVSTPTGSGKSLIAAAAHFNALATNGVSFYTAPIKALVSEKFFELCEQFGSDNVGMLTGDASVNPDAPLICATAEIVANLALREADKLDCASLVADEFHFYAEPDRGWAWQVPLLLLPQTQFTLLSATLGDTEKFEEGLTDLTGRDTLTVTGAHRPVPLDYEWQTTPLHETVQNLVKHEQAPAYIVHFAQAAALETATSLASLGLVSKEEKAAISEALGGFRFTTKFGQTLARLVRHGIGVHHAGMLPKYRRMVERLTQKGLLKVICGTDTLGVGINVPIRTVLFTGLTKYDGRRQRRLRAREFHQIAGRAGRAGYDTVGYVLCQAPEHVIENEKAKLKAAGDPKKLKKLKPKRPPDGFVSWSEETFTKLIDSPPETLQSRMKVNHAILLNVLERGGDAFGHVRELIEQSHETRREQLRLERTALRIGRSMRDTGIITTGEEGVRLGTDVPDNFALNEPLAPFALAALEILDKEDADYALDLLSIVESTLEGPGQILMAQKDKAKGEAIDSMKAEGVDYYDRMNAVEDITYARPLAEKLEPAYEAYQETNPWVGDYRLEPKSILRDIWANRMTFGEFVSTYRIGRSEGLLLRYLTSAYKFLSQTLPDEAYTDEVDDIVDWLGETIRQTDSSLINEWEQLANPVEGDEDLDPGRPSRAFTDNKRAFTIAVRNLAWRHVELAASDRPAALAELGTGWREHQWDGALEAYYKAHDDIGIDAEARSKEFFTVAEEERTWTVRQVVADPEGDRDWAIVLTVDLDASDEAGEVVAEVQSFNDEL
ncbi:DEAD/DEAH box helicase [Salininema proteolyticum]|uniref:DEAD/DEAH box helicase n=1 Tax=Salininema proteolyticum TaxID=1607685 RepID=A0ABV8U554_9ACTN